jgi:hypothetical protein
VTDNLLTELSEREAGTGSLPSSWVPRAMENYHLALASRILGEEIRIV